MARIKKTTQVRLNLKMDDLKKDLEALLTKYDLADLSVSKIQFSPDSGPPSYPCLNKGQQWTYVCSINGVCSWQCR